MSRPALPALLALALAAPAGAQTPLDTLGARHASGTAWQPDAVAAPALHAVAGPWALMLHGAASLGYVREESLKGGSRLGSTNWAMARASRPLAGGALALATMLSLETLTLGECGLPRLLETGPGCPTNFIGEYQHPHPPVMELSARWTRPLPRSLHLDLFAALVGEPALGPPAYLHRLSAAADPLAPIGSHETNPAHTSAGVLTAGIGTTRWKVEGSLFDGDAVDPDRVLPAPGGPGSVSARLSVNPSSRWSLQLSAARIEAAAGHHQGAEGEPIRSVVGSAIHHRALAGAGHWATTAALARMDDGTGARHGLLLESTLATGSGHALFGRAEIAQRPDATVTLIEHPDGTHDHLVDVVPRRVAQLSAGFRLARRLGPASLSAGVRGSVSFLPDAFVPMYRAERPLGFAAFLSLHPSAPRATGHGHH